jgi:hypothetical protein
MICVCLAFSKRHRVRKFGNKHVVHKQAHSSGRGEVGVLIIRFILSLLLCILFNDAVKNNNNYYYYYNNFSVR